MFEEGMFKGKGVTLMGLGLLGRGLGDAKFFATEGADLIVTDPEHTALFEPPRARHDAPMQAL